MAKNGDLNIQATMDVSDVTAGAKVVTSAIGDIEKKAKSANLDLPSLRYALYDVSVAANRIAGGLGNALAGVTDFAAKYETAFTDVERTTLSNVQLLESMRQQLTLLSQEIPLTFGEISGIASLGAQLGIATGDLGGFAKTVAEFAAVTNVGTESAAKSFGSLGELLNVSANQYQNLGSAVAQVGVESVATESEILAVATGIGGIANTAGLSADYVIGLSGALASLRVPAEQSRGALTRVFQEVSRSAAGTGVDMQKFADVMGVTRDEAQLLATSDMQTFFNKFIAGLSGLDTTNLTTTLDALSLADIRVTNVLTRLAGNTDLLNKTLADSATAFADGTFLSAVYALKVDDLASKFKTLQNSVQNLAATIGKALEPILKFVVDILQGVVNQLNVLGQTQAGQVFFTVAAGVAALSAALIGLVGAAAAGTASLFAVRFAIERLGWDSASKGLAGLIASLFGVVPASGAAVGGLTAVKAALIATGIGAAVVLVGTLVAAMIALSEASKNASASFLSVVGDTAGLSDAIAADTTAYKNAIAAGNNELASSFTAVEYAGTSLNEQYGETAKKVYAVAQVIGADIPNAFDYANSAIDQNTRYLGANTAEWFKNKLIQSDVFQQLANKGGVADLFTKIGFDFNTAVQLAASGGTDAVNGYFHELTRAALNSGKITIEQVSSADSVLAQELIQTNKTIADAPAGGPTIFFSKIATEIAKAVPFLADLWNGVANIFGLDISNVTGDVSQQFGGLAEQASIMELAFGDAGATGTDALDGIGGSADGATQKLRFLTDYANDLEAIFSRAFDIRFSGQSTLDDITKSFSSMAKATDDAREKIKELNADISQLTADKSLQEYFLKVAEAYGDTLRAAEIRAKLAKIDSQISAKNKDLATQQDKVNKTLTDNSDAAVQNRSDITGLVKTYQDHIKALAASGMKQDELRSTTAQLKNDFVEQAKQLGYNESELSIYAASFDDVTAAIDKVPRDLTVDFNGDPALTAIDEFVAKANQSLGGIGGGLSSSIATAADNAGASVGSGQTADDRRQNLTPKIDKNFFTDTAGMFADYWKNTAGMFNDFWENTGGMIIDYIKNTTGMWSDFFKNTSGMFKDFGENTSGMFKDLGENLKETFQPVWDVLTFPARLGESLASDLHLSELWSNLTESFKGAMGVIKTKWDEFWAPIGLTLSTKWEEFKTGFDDAMGGIKEGWDLFWNVAGAIIIVKWEEFKNGFTNAMSGIKEGWDSFWTVAGALIILKWEEFKNGFTDAMGSIQEGWDAFWNPIQDSLSSAWDDLKTGWDDTIASIESTWNDLWGRLGNTISSTIDNAMSGFQQQFPATFEVLKPIINWAFGKNYADGGYISGPGSARSDSIPANLSNGEYVINAAAVSSYGVGFFEQLNQMKAPRFANGGAVNVQQTNPSTMIVELSPIDRQLLAQAGNVQLSIDGKVIAGATNNSNYVSALRGSN